MDLQAFSQGKRGRFRANLARRLVLYEHSCWEHIVITSYVSDGEYHQFDSVIYPSRPFWKNLWGTNIPSQDEIQAIALKIYLEPYKARLCNFSEPPCNPEDFMDGILKVFSSLNEFISCIGDTLDKLETHQCKKLKNVSVFNFPHPSVCL